MSATHTDKPVLFWEMLNTEREVTGLLHSDYLTERAKVPGGWLVMAARFGRSGI